MATDTRPRMVKCLAPTKNRDGVKKDWKEAFHHVKSPKQDAETRFNVAAAQRAAAAAARAAARTVVWDGSGGGAGANDPPPPCPECGGVNKKHVRTADGGLCSKSRRARDLRVLQAEAQAFQQQ